MKNIIIKFISLVLVFSLILTLATGCNEKVSITKQEAYNIYYDTIEKFVPEIISEPQECDVEIKTRDEVIYKTKNFVRNTKVKIKSQTVDGKLQYYLLNEFPEVNQSSFYCINDNKSYMISCGSNGKGNLVEISASQLHYFTFLHLNTPFFNQDSIKSFSVKKKNSDIELIFVLDGANMEKGFADRVMNEIKPYADDKLDDVKIILTLDKNSIPKTMSTKLSMSIYNNGSLYAKKTLNMEFVFNKLNTVDFDLQTVISKYTLDTSSFK